MPNHGGRVTLRLARSNPERVEYEGSLTAEEQATWQVQATVSVADGVVEVAVKSGGEAPDWLAKMAKTTLRTAWRSTKTGTPWPRRVNRWRDDPSEDE